MEASTQFREDEQMKKKETWKMCALLLSAAVAVTGLPVNAYAAGKEAIMEASSDEETKGVFSLEGQLYNDTVDYGSELRSAEVKEETRLYQKQDWTVVNLVFESADANEENRNFIKLCPVVNETDIVEIGGAYYSNNLSQKMTEGVDGSFTSNNAALAAGRGPAQVKKSFYCIVTHEDGSKSYYVIDVLRKGFKGATTASYNDSNPYGISNYDRVKEQFYMSDNFLSLSGDTYDEEGNKTGELEWETVPTDKNTDNIWYTGKKIYAKRAGAFYLFTAEYNGVEYKVPVRAKYAKGDAGVLLERRRTDGTTALADFDSAEVFAEAFSGDEAEEAKSFYELIAGLQNVLDSNISDMQEGGWDYLLYSGVLWDEGCESAKLNQVMDMAPGVWENIYDMKKVKDEIGSYRNQEKYPEELRTVIQGIVDKYCAQIDEAYQAGSIKSREDAHVYLNQAKTELDAVKVSLADCEMTLDTERYVYDGEAKEPGITVKSVGGVVLGADDYTVEYENNIHAGTATAKVTGQGMYEGTKEAEFTIEKAPRTLAAERTAYEKKEGDEAFSLEVSVSPEKSLKYASSDEAVAAVSEDGVVTPLKAGDAVITVSAEEEEDFLGATLEITVTVGEEPQPDTEKPQPDTEKPQPDTEKPQPDTEKPQETQKPAKVEKLSVKSTKAAQLTVKWKRSAGVNGYQIVVAKDKKFKKPVKKMLVRGEKKQKAVVKKLKAGKKYFVRIRSFRKEKSGVVYSDWSKRKTLKVKKAGKK